MPYGLETDVSAWWYECGCGWEKARATGHSVLDFILHIDFMVVHYAWHNPSKSLHDMLMSLSIHVPVVQFLSRHQNQVSFH